MKKGYIIALLVLLSCVLIISSCGKNDYGDKPKVRMELEDGRTILMELYPNVAPLSVEFFIENVEDGYYNGKVFHRAVKGFIIQGGSSDGKGVKGTDKSIKGEFSANGIENTLSHTRGVLSLARNSLSMDSASGQFFIVQQDSEFLDGNYAAFGKVIEGIEVVDEIAEMEVRGINNDSLVVRPVIKSMTMVK